MSTIVRGSVLAAFVIVATACTSIAGIDKYHGCEGDQCTDPFTSGGSATGDLDAGECRFLGSCETLPTDGDILLPVHSCTEHTQSANIGRPTCNPLKNQVWREGERCPAPEQVMGCRLGVVSNAFTCSKIVLWFYEPQTREAALAACDDPIAPESE